MKIVWFLSIVSSKKSPKPIKDPWIIIILSFMDTIQEFIKKEEINSASDKSYLNLTTRLASESIKSVKAHFSIFY
jgi:hypothetical protein